MAGCYNKTTYCKHYKKCRNGETCKKALTQEVERAARDSGMTVCGYSERPECFEEKESN